MYSTCVREAADMQLEQNDVVLILTCCLLPAVKQLHKASRGQKHQVPQRQPWHSWLSRSQTPLVEEVKWSDLPVHAVCAVLAIGGHQLLRIARKRRQRGTVGGGGGGHSGRGGGGGIFRRHTHGRQVGNSSQGRSRLNGNHPRFL